jgi:uncharacterized membrane protein YgdD (TMEM256/DUF423 family)
VPITDTVCNFNDFTLLIFLTTLINYLSNFLEVFQPDAKRQKRVFNTALQYHFIHALAMLGLPLCRKPYLVNIKKFV